MKTKYKKEIVDSWFSYLHSQICKEFELIENNKFTFSQREWKKENKKEGGGISCLLEGGKIFDKVGVNKSTVSGIFPKKFRSRILGAEKRGKYWASGVSVVAHMKNPKIAAAHFNTRYITTKGKKWFGGGCDLTPAIPEKKETDNFHHGLKRTCDQHHKDYYDQFKKQCDEYFYLKHRNEPRGVGGIFFDYISENFEKDLSFIKDVGQYFINFIIENVNRKKDLGFDENDLKALFKKRSRYVEFNLLYDRGTLFGLKTGGNIDAILMSMPPNAMWD